MASRRQAYLKKSRRPVKAALPLAAIAGGAAARAAIPHIGRFIGHHVLPHLAIGIGGHYVEKAIHKHLSPGDGHAPAPPVSVTPVKPKKSKKRRVTGGGSTGGTRQYDRDQSGKFAGFERQRGKKMSGGVEMGVMDTFKRLYKRARENPRPDPDENGMIPVKDLHDYHESYYDKHQGLVNTTARITTREKKVDPAVAVASTWHAGNAIKHANAINHYGALIKKHGEGHKIHVSKIHSADSDRYDRDSHGRFASFSNAPVAMGLASSITSSIGDKVVRATIRITKPALPYLMRVAKSLGVKILKTANETKVSDLGGMVVIIVVIEGARRALMLLRELLAAARDLVGGQKSMGFAEDEDEDGDLFHELNPVTQARRLARGVKRSAEGVGRAATRVGKAAVRSTVNNALRPGEFGRKYINNLGKMVGQEKVFDRVAQYTPMAGVVRKMARREHFQNIKKKSSGSREYDRDDSGKFAGFDRPVKKRSGSRRQVYMASMMTRREAIKKMWKAGKQIHAAAKKAQSKLVKK